MENPLLEKLVDQTGLPRNLIKQELSQILKHYGFSPDKITLDDLREVMAEYLQDTFIELKTKQNP